MIDIPRSARKISNTKVYHIILRGNDRQDIFLEEQDYRKFIKEIIDTKEKYYYDLYAYCLMTNHIHLILYDKEDKLSKIMQSLAVSYSSYFCKKYDKVGHLFQNRFLSKNVETREYLMQLCRYIHQNPVKAGIAKIDEYKWSSYNEYLGNEDIVNTKMILSILGKEKHEAIKNFIAFQNLEKEDIAGEAMIEYEMLEKLTDEEVKKIMENILKINSIAEIKQLKANVRDEKLKELKVIKKTSRAQIARVIGINKKIVERAMK